MGDRLIVSENSLDKERVELKKTVKEANRKIQGLKDKAKSDAETSRARSAREFLELKHNLKNANDKVTEMNGIIVVANRERDEAKKLLEDVKRDRDNIQLNLHDATTFLEQNNVKFDSITGRLKKNITKATIRAINYNF